MAKAKSSRTSGKRTSGKRTPGKRTAGKRASGKRTRISPRGDARYIRRDAKGRIIESDDVGRSQRADRRTKARTKTKSGHGDRGDR